MDNPLITLSQMGVEIHVFRDHIPTWKPLSIVLPITLYLMITDVSKDNAWVQGARVNNATMLKKSKHVLLRVIL